MLRGITISGVSSLIAVFVNPHKPPNHSVGELIIKINHGDQELRNEFICQYRPFIVKTVSAFLGHRYVDVDNSEEFSIGLMAFDEAISCYNASKNRNFFDFARQVIKRRIINYWVTNQKQKANECPFTYFQKEDPEFLDKIPDQTAYFIQNYETRDEILLFKERLADFGITIKDLVVCSPKHKDSRLFGIGIAKIISDNEDLFTRMMADKTLPILSLLKMVNVNRRTLERNRKFIIAICLILRSDLEILKCYVHQILRDSEII